MHRRTIIEYCPWHKGPTCFCLNVFGCNSFKLPHRNSWSLQRNEWQNNLNNFYAHVGTIYFCKGTIDGLIYFNFGRGMWWYVHTFPTMVLKEPCQLITLYTNFICNVLKKLPLLERCFTCLKFLSYSWFVNDIFHWIHL